MIASYWSHFVNYDDAIAYSSEVCKDRAYVKSMTTANGAAIDVRVSPKKEIRTTGLDNTLRAKLFAQRWQLWWHIRLETFEGRGALISIRYAAGRQRFTCNWKMQIAPSHWSLHSQKRLCD